MAGKTVSSDSKILIELSVFLFVLGVIVAFVIYYVPITHFNHFALMHSKYVKGDSILIPVGDVPSGVKVVYCNSTISYKDSVFVDKYSDWLWFVNKSNIVFSCFDSYRMTYYTYTVYNGKYIVFSVNESVVPGPLRDYAGTVVKGNTVYYVIDKNLIKAVKMNDVYISLILFGGLGFVFLLFGLIDRYEYE